MWYVYYKEFKPTDKKIDSKLEYMSLLQKRQ